MTTIREEWLEYLRHCYPAGISKAHHDQIQKAFYAGCCVFIQKEHLIAEMTTAQGERALKALHDEVVGFVEAAISSYYGRN
jgi:hypothetical protein